MVMSSFLPGAEIMTFFAPAAMCPFAFSASVNGPLELALDGVVLQQVGEVGGRDDVTDRDHLHLFAEQALRVEGPEHEPSDATETIDGDAGHLLFSPCYSVQTGQSIPPGRNTASATARRAGTSWPISDAARPASRRLRPALAAP